MINFEFRAYLTRPYDGDSFWVMADTLFGQRYEPELRLSGVHAAELGEEGAAQATAFVAEWFTLAPPAIRALRWPLLIKTEKTRTIEPNQRKTFERYLATVWDYTTDHPRCLNHDVDLFLASHPEWGPGQ